MSVTKALATSAIPNHHPSARPRAVTLLGAVDKWLFGYSIALDPIADEMTELEITKQVRPGEGSWDYVVNRRRHLIRVLKREININAADSAGDSVAHDYRGQEPSQVGGLLAVPTGGCTRILHPTRRMSFK